MLTIDIVQETYIKEFITEVVSERPMNRFLLEKQTADFCRAWGNSFSNLSYAQFMVAKLIDKGHLKTDRFGQLYTKRRN